jgi:hypothetical protein
MSNEPAERLLNEWLIHIFPSQMPRMADMLDAALAAERRATVERTLQIIAAHGHKVPLEHDGWADDSTWDEHIEQHIRAQK